MKDSTQDRLTSGDDVCAIVVTYHPDAEFPTRLSRILEQVHRLIIVTPRTPPQIIPRESVKGRGVMAIESYGGTSGRFDVAEVSARIFPDVMADFIARVKAEGFPYPDDQYTYLNPKLVKFTTPAHHDGIGTGIFVPSADPVRGVVSLAAGDERETNLLQYDLRLSPSDDRLAHALIDLELQCISSSWPSC
jgi:hypothetical protein